MRQKIRHPPSEKTTTEQRLLPLTPSQTSTSALAHPLLNLSHRRPGRHWKELDDEDDNDTDTRTCVRVPRRDRRRRRECLFADPRHCLGFVATAGVARPGEAIHVDAARRR